MMYVHSSPEGSEYAEEEGLAEFFALPRHIQRKIDSAFNHALPKASRIAECKAAKKQHKSTGAQDIDGGGGFLPPSDGSDDGGGFIVDPDEQPADDRGPDSPAFRISLSHIPRALQILDIPQDADVLAVFKNAASGWKDAVAGEEDAVSRKDWRAVCAILLEDPTATGLENEDEDGFAPETEGEGEGSERDEDEDDNDNESDEYKGSDAEESDLTEDNDSDSAYMDEATEARKGKASKRKRLRESSPEETSGSKNFTLTSRQKRECRVAWALFFPDTEDADLDNNRILIRDVSKAAKTLNEKLTSEDIIEMLDFFSTSPDKALTLQDFEQMMMRVHLV